MIVPTYQRPEGVVRTLVSLGGQTLPPEQFEVIVVDNSPSDRVRTGVETAATGKVRVRYLPEPTLGASQARHTGARQARGDILAFVDDDIVCDPEWLEHILEVFADPAVGCAGGKVLPVWQIPPPEWVLAYPGALALLDLGGGARQLRRPEVVYSCNFAIRRRVLFELGGFNPDLVGEKYMGDGEVGLVWKVYEAGWKVAYAGTAVVQHHISGDRLTLAYMRARFVNQGISDSYSSFRRHESRAWLLLRLPLLAAAALGYKTAAAVLGSTRGPRYYHSKLFCAYCTARLRYDLELMTSPELRRLVCRRDWITEPVPSCSVSSVG